MNEGLVAELALMKEKYERVLIELGTPDDKKKASKCKDCTALKVQVLQRNV